jgi:hypothetical protein
MKRETFADVVELSGVQLRVNNGDGKYSCYVEILRAIKGQLSAMLSHHSKVLIFRLDLHREGYSRDNLEFSRFVEKIKKRARQHYKAKRLGYVWVREHEKAKQQHYHLALMIDANKVQHPGRLINWIERRWEARGHPKPYTPGNCFKVLRRGSESGFSHIFERLSYMAKTRGKGYRASAVNDYSTSRIKPKHLIKHDIQINQ